MTPLASFEPISQSKFLLQVNLKGLYFFQALIQPSEDSLFREILCDFYCGRLERSPPLPFGLLHLRRIILVDPITHIHEILGSIPGTECQLNKHTLPRTIYDLIEVMIVSIPATRSIRDVSGHKYSLLKRNDRVYA